MDDDVTLPRRAHRRGGWTARRIVTPSGTGPEKLPDRPLSPFEALTGERFADHPPMPDLGMTGWMFRRSGIAG